MNKEMTNSFYILMIDFFTARSSLFIVENPNLYTEKYMALIVLNNKHKFFLSTNMLSIGLIRH